MKELMFVLMIFGLLAAVLVGVMNDSKGFNNFRTVCEARGGFAVNGIGGQNGCVKLLP